MHIYDKNTDFYIFMKKLGKKAVIIPLNLIQNAIMFKK